MGSTPSEQSIELIFALKQSNVHKLEETLMQVSSPSSPHYGNHLSNEEVHALTAPAPEHIEAVKAFLKMHGVEGEALTPNGDMIAVTVQVRVAERMLSSSYVRLLHPESNTTVDRCPDGYSLPRSMAEAVDFVAPTMQVPASPHPPSFDTTDGARANSVSGLFSVNNPKNLRQLYEIGSAVGKAETNKQAVTAFLKQYYSESDLKKFWSKHCDGIDCGKGLPKLVGDATSGSAGTEAMLDIEYITGVGGNIETEFWGFAGNSPDNAQNEPFMKWLAHVSNTSDAEVPLLFSSSYGEKESTWSHAAAVRLNTEFMKAGVRGITILFASGDSGATCSGSKFHPNFPASSPYVTAVGGTAPSSGFPAPGSETAISLSSGGFSDKWPMPEYQKSAVAAYLKHSGLPSASSRGYNVSGRAFPDIAAQATKFCVVPGGCFVAGTSCASPTAAGIIGLLNDLRAQNGKPALGFLNPMLYENAAALNDIVSGHSKGCSFFGGGWPATTGWDAVTGLGTPSYKRLAEVVASLPDGNSLVV